MKEHEQTLFFFYDFNVFGLFIYISVYV